MNISSVDSVIDDSLVMVNQFLLAFFVFGNFELEVIIEYGYRTRHDGKRKSFFFGKKSTFVRVFVANLFMEAVV
jgi:hypothetical protein